MALAGEATARSNGQIVSRDLASCTASIPLRTGAFTNSSHMVLEGSQMWWKLEDRADWRAARHRYGA